MKDEARYTVSQVANLAGVSVRTLHHYDKIGLLRPREYSASGYRLYGREDLERLQVILFYRELDFPLKEIRRLLGDRHFDLRSALMDQGRRLEERKRRLEGLIQTLEKTLKQGGEHMLTDQELYEGFSPEEIKTIREEVRRRWDPEMETEAKIRKMSKVEFDAIKKEMDAITRRAAQVFEDNGDDAARALKDPRSRELMADWYRHVSIFSNWTAESFKNLGQGYVDDPRFTKTYDGYRKGLAVYMRDAMAWYADEVLSGT